MGLGGGLVDLLEAVIAGGGSAAVGGGGGGCPMTGGRGQGKAHGGGGGGGSGGVKVEAVHRGVTCDKSGMSPIVGPRFHVPGNDYDLCAAEFAKLPEAERMMYVEIAFPGAPHVPCFHPEPKAAAATAAAAEVAVEAAPSLKSSAAAEETGSTEEPERVLAEKAALADVAQAQAAAAEKAEVKATAEAKAAAVAEAKAADEAAAATKALEAQYGEQLVALAALGMDDHDTNLALLERYQGRLERVINTLLDAK
jgi:hypothetical protein